MRFELKQLGEAISSDARIRIASQRSNGTAGNDMRAVVDDVRHSVSFAFEARRYPGKCRRVYHFARPRLPPAMHVIEAFDRTYTEADIEPMNPRIRVTLI